MSENVDGTDQWFFNDHFGGRAIHRANGIDLSIGQKLRQQIQSPANQRDHHFGSEQTQFLGRAIGVLSAYFRQNEI